MGTKAPIFARGNYRTGNIKYLSMKDRNPLDPLFKPYPNTVVPSVGNKQI